jgi:type II secretory pathway pseudopilin PulG
MVVESTVDSATVDDRGETLVEILVTLVVLSTAVIALVIGIGAAVTMSDIHRKQATAGAHLRDFADAVESYVTGSGAVQTGYATCPTVAPLVAASNYQAAYTDPDQTHYTATVASLAYWDTSTNPPSWKVMACPSNGDSGLQRISLRVVSNGTHNPVSETLDIIIRLPCRLTDTPC